MKKIKTVAPFLGISQLTVLMVSVLIAFTGCNDTEEDDFVAVTGITGVATVAEVNIPLTLTATVSPSDATNQAIVWSVKDAGTTGATLSGGNTLTTTAAGTATVTATIAGGASRSAPFTKDFSITVNDDFVAVSDITKVPTEAEVDAPLTLAATVTPSNATNQTIVWSVKDAGTTGASLSEGNILTATAAGTATVTATIANGASRNTPFTKDFSIIVTDDFVAVTEISDVPTEAEVGVPLTLTATVMPSDATNQTIEWSIKDAGTTGASISEGNILTATDEGTVTVTATIANGASRNEPFVDDFTVTVIKVDKTVYYQGASGYVKFKVGNAYIRNRERYGELVFGIGTEGDNFYLDKIDNTRYLIKYVDFYGEEVYVAPAAVVPGGVDIRILDNFTVVSATREGDQLKIDNGMVVDLKNPNDYTYSFIYDESTGGYTIISELISDLSSYGILGSSYYIYVDPATEYLYIRGDNEWSPEPTSFAIEETEHPFYIDFGDEKYVRIFDYYRNNEYLYEDGTSAFSSNTKGITYLEMYNSIQYPNMKDVFKLKKVGVSEGKSLYTIYSEGEGTGNGGGGYLTDATDLAFNPDGSLKNPDYTYYNTWVRLTFEAEPTNNSVFAFRKRNPASTDFFYIETASGDASGANYIGLQNNGIVILKNAAHIFGWQEVER